jgi:hypothetical protein
MTFLLDEMRALRAVAAKLDDNEVWLLTAAMITVAAMRAEHIGDERVGAMFEAFLEYMHELVHTPAVPYKDKGNGGVRSTGK